MGINGKRPPARPDLGISYLPTYLPQQGLRVLQQLRRVNLYHDSQCSDNHITIQNMLRGLLLGVVIYTPFVLYGDPMWLLIQFVWAFTVDIRGCGYIHTVCVSSLSSTSCTALVKASSPGTSTLTQPRSIS